MSRTRQIFLLVVIALLAELGFIATGMVLNDTTNIQAPIVATPTSSQGTKKSDEELNAALAALPSEGEIVGIQKLHSEVDSRWIVTKLLPRPEHFYQNRGYPVQFWFLRKGREPILLKERDFDSPYFLIGYEFEQHDRMIVRTKGGTDLAMYQIFSEDLFDIDQGAWMAGTSWDDLLKRPRIDFPGGAMDIKMQATNGCAAERDSYEALQVNKENIPFKNKVSFTCEEVCAARCEYFAPGVGKPYFHDGKFVSFNLPWGTPVTIDLEHPVLGIHSKDFVKEYPFQ